MNELSKQSSLNKKGVENSTLKETGLTQAERTELSDKRMFEATITLINQRGPSGTSLKEVGELAGYSRGLASHRFGSKEKLFQFVVKQLARLWLEQLTSVTKGKSGIDAIECAIDKHYEFCFDTPSYVQALYTLWFEAATTNSELTDTMKEIHHHRFQDVVNWILQSPKINQEVKKQADVIAAQFSSTVIGIVYHCLMNSDRESEIKALHDGLKKTMRVLLHLNFDSSES